MSKGGIKKIYIFSLWYHPFHFGLHIDDVAKAFIKNGYEVEVVTIRKKDSNLPYFLPFKNIKTKRTIHCRIHRMSIYKIFDRHIYNPIIIFDKVTIRNISKHVLVDLKLNKEVHFFHFFDTFLPWFNKEEFKKIKWCNVYFAGSFFKRNGYQLGIKDTLLNKRFIFDINMSHVLNSNGTIKGVDYILSQTKSLATDIKSLNAKIDVKFIPRPFDLDMVLRTKAFDIRKKYNINKATKIYIFVGRQAKNIYTLLEIFRKISDIVMSKLIIIGIEKKFLEKLDLYYILKDKIIVEERLPRAKIYGFLKSSDTLLYTGLIDGYPKIINEAQACKLPIVCFKSTGSSVDEIIKNGYNGFIVEENKIDYFVKAVILLQNNKKILSKIVKNSYTDVMHFSDNNFIKSI